MLNKNDIRECVIDNYTAEGYGVGRVDGMAVFVPMSARGDRLSVRIVKTHKTYAYGRIEGILEPSSHRIEPVCPVFARCGGCDFLHLDYEEELWLKTKRVEDALRRVGGFDDITVPLALATDRKGYRNKAQFLPCVGANGRASFGFYRSRSHQVVETGPCAIQSGEANNLAAAVCAWMDESGADAYDEEKNEGLVRRIYIRSGGEGCQLCIVARSERLPKADRLVELARQAEPSLKGVVVNVNPGRTNKIMGGRCVTIWGEDRLEDELLGLKFRLSPLSFYQVNHAQAERLYTKALELADLGPNDTALDLYCGAGTITLLLARRCARAIGNEIIPEAVEDARQNALNNNIANAEFILGDAGQAASQLAEQGLRPNVIVVDPPRKGMDAAAIEAVAAMAPDRVVYISCDPASLARDCAQLARKGYRLDTAQPVDMFPATAHVETAALLTRADKI